MALGAEMGQLEKARVSLVKCEFPKQKEGKDMEAVRGVPLRVRLVSAMLQF